MLTDVHRLALFPQSLKCTHNLLGSMCVKNTRPSWWLIYFIARDRQGFPPPPLFIKLGHLVTFASWFKPQQSQENSFPTRRTGRRRRGKRKEQKKKQEKGVLWDQWCKKLFLLSAAWLTFPADTDKRMGKRKRGRQKNKWDYWCYVSTIIADLNGEEERTWADGPTDPWNASFEGKGQQVTEFGPWPRAPARDTAGEWDRWASKLSCYLFNFNMAAHMNTHLRAVIPPLKKNKVSELQSVRCD